MTFTELLDVEKATGEVIGKSTINVSEGRYLCRCSLLSKVKREEVDNLAKIMITMSNVSANEFLLRRG